MTIINMEAAAQRLHDRANAHMEAALAAHLSADPDELEEAAELAARMQAAADRATHLAIRCRLAEESSQ